MSNPVSIKIPSLFLLIAFILGASFYFYETILEVAPGTIVSQLMASFHLSGVTVSILDTCYFMTYAVMQIPGGSLLDRFGARRLLIFATSACGVGNLLLASTSNFQIALISRLLMGLGGSFGLLGALFIVSRYFPKRIALFMGLAIMLGLSGGLLQSPIEMLVLAKSWRFLVNSLGIVALLLMVIIYLCKFAFPLDDLQHSAPENTVAISGREKSISSFNFEQSKFKKNRILQLITIVICKPQSWMIALYGGLMYIPTGTLGSFWGTELLQAHYPLQSKALLANANAMIFLGWIIGSPIAGWISDYLRKRKPLLIVGSIGLLSMLLAIVYIPLVYLELCAAFLLVGVFSAFSGLTFAMVSEINPPKCSGVAIGFTNTLAIIPSIVVSPLFGWILDKVAGKITNFPWSAFQAAMWLEYGVIAVAVVLAVMMIRETVER